MLCVKHFTRYEIRDTRYEFGVTLIELILGLVIFAIIVPGIILILSKGMETFFFEREEVVVQRDMRNVMDQMTDKLRQATGITAADLTNIGFEVFGLDGHEYSWDSETKNIYDAGGSQLNSQEIEVTSFSFSYYKDITNQLSPLPLDASKMEQVKAVGIEMEFQKDDNPIMELKSWVLIRNLL